MVENDPLHALHAELTIRHATVNQRTCSPTPQACATSPMPIFIALAHFLIPRDDWRIRKWQHDTFCVRIALFGNLQLILCRCLHALERAPAFMLCLCSWSDLSLRLLLYWRAFLR